MATHVDPFTGRPYKDPDAELDTYDEVLDEGDQDIFSVEKQELPVGYIRQGERQAGQRFQWAVAIPLLVVTYVITVGVGFFTAFLVTRGTMLPNYPVLEPAVVIAGALAAVGSVAAALYLWPDRVPVGWMRTVGYGVVGGAVLFAAFVLFLAIAFRVTGGGM